ASLRMPRPELVVGSKVARHAGEPVKEAVKQLSVRVGASPHGNPRQIIIPDASCLPSHCFEAPPAHLALQTGARLGHTHIGNSYPELYRTWISEMEIPSRVRTRCELFESLPTRATSIVPARSLGEPCEEVHAVRIVVTPAALQIGSPRALAVRQHFDPS